MWATFRLRHQAGSTHPERGLMTRIGFYNPLKKEKVNIMKLLIGCDGTECADAALDDLRRAGLPDSGEAMIISVAKIWTYAMAGPRGDIAPGGISEGMWPAVRDAQRYAETEIECSSVTASAAASRFAALFPGWKVTSMGVPDSPRWALVKKADEWKPDLVVVGSHGKSLLDHLTLGSVSHSVLTHAQCSVRIGRHAHRNGHAPRLVVGIDGSTESSHAVAAIASRKWPAETKVQVVCVVDSTMSTTLPLEGFVKDWVPGVYVDSRDWIAHATRRVSKELMELGLSAEPLLLDGDPKEVLVEQAERWNADCIFVGAKGMSRLARFLIGSVSTAVASRAHCSVEVVRHEPSALS
jgi:nucleotide-binding universal stress UspA family protein